MNGDQFLFSSGVVDFAEEQDYLTLRNRICFFNSCNLNKVQIDYDESTLEQCQSLVNMPVVCRYVRANGQDDLGGHEVSYVDGKIKFGTATVGVVTGVEIKQEDVETVTGEVKNLPVLYADERIWTRNENVSNAIKRLYKDGKLYSSWEVKTSDYRFENGVKYLLHYTFLSNCLLGSRSYPAYGTGGARVIDVSSVSDCEYLAAESILSEALAMDIESASASNINQLDDTNRKEDLSMDVNENIAVNVAENATEEEAVETVEVEETADVGVEGCGNNDSTVVSEDNPAEESTTDNASEAASVETVEAEETDGENGENGEAGGDNEPNESEEEEISAVKTDDDIRMLIGKALEREGHTDGKYYYLAMVFPEEKVILCRAGEQSALQFTKFNYVVGENEVSLSGKEEIEFVISPLNINSEIESKNNAIAEANNRIVELENKNAELIKAQEELNKLKSEQQAAEHAKAVNELRDYVIRSNRFTEEELQSEEIQKAINELNESWLKAEIADRLVASLGKENVSKNNKNNKNGIDTSESNSERSVAIVLSEEKKSVVTSKDVMREFFENYN